jgi:murein DD-endopeptidase MepM/ murein hydrolase activator NlpD
MNRRLLRLLGILGIMLAGLMLVPTEACAQRGLDLENDTLTQSVLIHPPIEATGKRLDLSTREHTYRSQLRLVDQLARDFTLQKVEDDGIARDYKRGTGGTENEDWYGWRADVLAPFESTVTRVVEPDTVNAPGTMNREAQPGLIIFEDEEEDITVAYAHIREPEVKKGETVEAGEVVAKVGNNGNSRAPHVHVGAWAGEPDLLGAKTGAEPLQIQVDLYAEERSGMGEANQ